MMWRATHLEIIVSSAGERSHCGAVRVAWCACHASSDVMERNGCKMLYRRPSVQYRLTYCIVRINLYCAVSWES